MTEGRIRQPQRPSCSCSVHRERWELVRAHGDGWVYRCPACGRQHYELVVDPGELQGLLGGEGQR